MQPKIKKIWLNYGRMKKSYLGCLSANFKLLIPNLTIIFGVDASFSSFALFRHKNTNRDAIRADRLKRTHNSRSVTRNEPEVDIIGGTKNRKFMSDEIFPIFRTEKKTLFLTQNTTCSKKVITFTNFSTKNVIFSFGKWVFLLSCKFFSAWRQSCLSP